MADLTQPLTSICIVTYKRDDTLVDSLRRLLASTCRPSEIFVVDNARSPALPERLREFSVPVKLLYPEGNVGCAGLNLAFRQARGKYVFCFDDDSFPAPDCLEKAVRAFDADATLGMIGFKMHEPEAGQPWHDRWWNPDSKVVASTVFCPGCGLAFRNDVRLPNEICVPDIVSQAHELSMAAEILRLGYRIEFRPDCMAFHPDTTKGYSGEKARNGNRNQLRFLIRYADPLNLVILLASQLILATLRQPNEARFAFDYFFSIRRRPLPRRIARQFHEVFSWHAYHRLGHFL
jgi:glycosyltransferase involved in cell wall biosynthesis